MFTLDPQLGKTFRLLKAHFPGGLLVPEMSTSLPLCAAPLPLPPALAGDTGPWGTNAVRAARF